MIKTTTKILSNKYVIASVFFLGWMLFVDQRDYFQQQERKADLQKLEAKKQYYMRTFNPDILEAELRGIDLDNKFIYEYIYTLPDLIPLDPIDLTRHMYRLRTLQILYEARTAMINKETPNKICEKMNDFLTNMKTYIDANQLHQLFSLEQKISLFENEIIQLKNQLSKYENLFTSSGIHN
jgi:hypothetical protein